MTNLFDSIRATKGDGRKMRKHRAPSTSAQRQASITGHSVNYTPAPIKVNHHGAMPSMFWIK